MTDEFMIESMTARTIIVRHVAHDHRYAFYLMKEPLNERAPSKAIVRRSSTDRWEGIFATFFLPEGGSRLRRA